MSSEASRQRWWPPRAAGAAVPCRRFAVSAGPTSAGVAVLIGLTVWAQYSARIPASLLWLDIAVGLAGCCLMPALLRWPTATALALGALDQARHALIGSLRERARRAEAEQGRRVAEARALERTRIAREMHDVLAHRLSLIAAYAGALEYRPDAPPGQLTQSAAVIRAGAHDALSELRDVIAVLREDGEAGGPPERPQPVLADVPRLVAESRAAGQPAGLDCQLAGPDSLPAATGRTAYRIVQEALTNARRHAPGQPVRVAIGGRAGEGLTIEVRNRLPAAPPGAPSAPTPGSPRSSC